MTLLEAINSGRKFKPSNLNVGFVANMRELLNHVNDSDALNGSYELEPMPEFTITRTSLATMWDRVKPASVASSTTSEFFKRLMLAIEDDNEV